MAISWMMEGPAWTIDGILQAHGPSILKVPNIISTAVQDLRMCRLTICQPRGNDRTKIPSTVIDGGENGSVLGMNQLGDQKRSCSVGDSNTESNEETSSNEHVNVGANGLQNNTNDHDDTASDDTGTSSSNIGDIGSDGQSNDGTDRHNGVQQASSRCSWGVES